MKLLINSRERDKNKISLVDKNKVVKEVIVKDIVSGIDKFLKENKLSFKEIEIFELENKPGSFTGLKVGASIVNALNFALGKIKNPKDIITPTYGHEPNIG